VRRRDTRVRNATSKSRSRKQPAGIREIAGALSTSIGTVDRALHDRPGINPKTRKRILEMAKKLGYRPNLAARFLSSRKQVRIGINIDVRRSG